jgi:hypothetical protein
MQLSDKEIMIETLADLLHPHDPSILFNAAHNHRRLLLRSDRARQFAALAPWDRLNALITAERIVSGSVKMARNGFSLPVEMLVERNPVSLSLKHLQIGALQKNCQQGLSIVINGIEGMIQPIALMNAIVEREFRAPVHTNAYLSFNRDSAFKPHWDNHNVLILQIHGRKRWSCWGQPWRFPVDEKACQVPANLGEPEWEGVLEPGDILYVPRGDIHAAKVLDNEDSVHLTVTIVPPRADVLMQHLPMLCNGEEIMRRDLPVFATAQEQEDWMAAVKTILHRAVDQLDLDQVMSVLDSNRKPLQVPSLGLIARLTTASRIQPALRRRLPDGWNRNEEIKVRAERKSWRLNAQEGVILDHLLRHHTSTVAALLPLLPDMDTQAVIKLVTNLATQGVLIVLPEQEGV